MDNPQKLKRTFVPPIFDHDEIHEKKIILCLDTDNYHFEGIAEIFVTRKGNKAAYDVHFTSDRSGVSHTVTILYLTEPMIKLIKRTGFEEYPFEMINSELPDWYNTIPKKGEMS